LKLPILPNLSAREFSNFNNNNSRGKSPQSILNSEELFVAMIAIRSDYGRLWEIYNVG